MNKICNEKKYCLPNEFIEIKNIKIIQSLFSIPAAEYVEKISNFIAWMRCSAPQI